MLNIFKTKNKLEKLLNPKSIAVVGATEKEGKVGNVISRNLLDLDYEGKVFFVNPKHEEMFGQKSFKSLEEIKEGVDLAIISIPADFVIDVIKRSADSVKNFVVISAGFSETGEDGKEKEKELLELAEEKKINILGPNCLGFINPKINLNASFAGGMPKDGNIAFISQSGALAVALMDVARKENLKFSNIISIGNKMQIDETELIKYFGDDEKTKVISLYIEGIKDGEKFIKVAQEVSKKKPIVVLKSGKTEKSQKAISSHTGALAGSDKIMDAAFEKAGVLRADNIENFFDLIKIISVFDAPKNDKVAIVTNAGGPGVLTTDSFEGKSLKIADFSDKIKEKLRMILPHESSVENPIDLLGDAQEDRYEKTLSIVDREDIATIFCVLTPQDQTPVDKIAAKIINFKNKTDKIVSTIFIGGERIKGMDKLFEENGIPNFPFPERAVNALNKYYEWKNKDILKSESFSENGSRKKKAENIIKKSKGEGRKALLFGEAKEIMNLYKINTVDVAIFEADSEVRELRFDFPVVAKVDSDKVLHKTDKQGLILNIENQEELIKAIESLRKNFPGENVIVQPMLPIKTELILGIKRDSVFGPIVVYGLGGIYTEIFKMVDFLVLPAGVSEIKKKLKESSIGFLFEETRGQKPYDIDEMSKIISNLGALALELGEVDELDINPLLVYPNEKAVAVDVKIIF